MPNQDLGYIKATQKRIEELLKNIKKENGSLPAANGGFLVIKWPLSTGDSFTVKEREIKIDVDKETKKPITITIIILPMFLIFAKGQTKSRIVALSEITKEDADDINGALNKIEGIKPEITIE